MLKKSILKIYDFIFPKDSIARFRLYSEYLWFFFPDPIDKFLLNYSETYKEIKFIQIGANDGASFDPVYKFVKKYNWSGILIEPLQPYFDELKRNYEKLKNRKLYFEHCAISDQSGTGPIYYISNLSGKEKDYEVLKAVSSFNRVHVRGYIENRKKLEVKSVEVAFKTLDEIIDEYHFEDLNILIIDAEGYDFEIIKTINFDKIRPEVILYEHIHLPEKDREMCLSLLGSYEYHYFEDGINTLAYR